LPCLRPRIEHLFQGLPITTLAGLLSAAGLLFAAARGWPIWAVGAAALLPWLPLFGAQTLRTYRRYQWLALFYALVVTQTGHVLEHAAQMVQLHVLGLSGPSARGVFGALDVEWVHFTWNTWVIVAVVALLWHYRTNRWLWLAAPFVFWHQVEHSFILSVFLSTGVAGTPGLVSMGGAFAGGLPIARPELHFAYNLLETLPLIGGFISQVRRV
jgi:hypothetical protein